MPGNCWPLFSAITNREPRAKLLLSLDRSSAGRVVPNAEQPALGFAVECIPKGGVKWCPSGIT